MKRSHFHIPFVLALLLRLLPAAELSLVGQEPVVQAGSDSTRVMELYSEALGIYEGGEAYGALNTLGEALQLAMQLNMEDEEARILELIGDVYMSGEDAEAAIPYYLRVASLREFAGDSALLYPIYRKTGEAYSKAAVYEKALEHYRKAAALTGETGISVRLELAEIMGTASMRAGRPEEAGAYFLQYQSLLAESGADPMPAWTRLVQVYRETKDDEKCLEYSRKLLDHPGIQGDQEELALLHNNMGFYLTGLSRYQEALEHYALAMELAGKAGLTAGRIALMRANMGVCYQNMNEPREARVHLNQAISSLRKSGYPGDRSRIEHIQALIYLNENDLYNAGLFCREAISSAEEAGDARLLSDAYFTYSRILRAGNDPGTALQYYESYLAIRDSLQLEEKLGQQRLEQRISRLEQSENDLLLRLQQERVNELAINRLTLQLEREEQARELLQRENDVQLLEQERLRQSMIIAEQQYRVEQQERQNRILEQEQRLSQMALEQEQQKQREAEQEIVVLEQQQRLDQLSLEKQKTQRKALIGVVVLMVLVVILVTGSLVLTRKKNLLLARQKREIEEKNLDLEQKNEEISAQRDEIEAQRDEIEAQRDELEAQRNMLFEQKEAIEQYNLEILQSIQYAERIQSATLPDLEVLREKGSDYFVLYRPRDVVSGDFYWMAEVEGSLVLAVVDCTGHGVPGAFMSILGMSLLKEIVQKEYLTHPGVILRRMRKEIIKSLGQKGISGEQRDGMDVSLIEFSPDENRVQYAGAFNALYLVRENGLKAPEIDGIKILEGEPANGHTLYEIPADRMPVAFFDRMDKFTTRRFTLEKGDQLYLFTDGYADQFGGEHGKKFKYLPFKKMILDHAGMPMEEQYSVMKQTLDNWMGDYDQIDDICVVGWRY